ncbi:zeta toxin family protein [Novosphingobium sp. G106]|uniref:zeta toxin family protein n=1 Tax=Novosphingobium sp. G106 TaxID=2849500 RepID=UPI001C2D40F0|nr:zeta toxin family protein [Novosphingobium sp. G106]MBV1692101.1 zeta toxin family protein [Novosphingobium sp. G106]
MIVLAGPNGAGKSTLYAARIAPSFAGLFINADIIQRDELRDPSPTASYKAADIASSRRGDCLAQGRDFVTETVFSHPSKLELIDEARTRGFTVIVMHVGVDTPDLSVARVGARVEEGGHIVPEDKIRTRYGRGAPFIRAAVLKADRGMVFDNSRLNQPPSHCLTFANGRLVYAVPRLPGWIRSAYQTDLYI